MKREWYALGAAILASTAALAGAAIFGQILQKSAQVVSHQQPTHESWLTAQPVFTPDMIEHGRKLFLGSCAHCHGANARGDEGPDLHDLQVSDRHIENVIKNGIKGEMPAFAKKHTAVEVTELRAYLRTLN